MDVPAPQQLKLPFWRYRLAAKPLRRIISRSFYSEQLSPYMPDALCCIEHLECGHSRLTAFDSDIDFDARRRRCAECADAFITVPHREVA